MMLESRPPSGRRSLKGSFRPFPSLPSSTRSFCSSLLALEVPLDYFLLAKPSCRLFMLDRPPLGGMPFRSFTHLMGQTEVLLGMIGWDRRS
ncbi:hypothetical protein PRIPAC_87393 [Pristionchus pacificus]|uniref:Uncharacterized protein n=1 Tax=Pristionchus pacificus TaxID=54126 RepID=A0A2A6B8B7_PRIPA|nr:hypothetical protein PRIPAC_87393 [Pristionchus pacificus]|eukprot:PDM62122.1 hypothetical protein PRIPAC_51564 [Pristionchus pacificus]